MFRTPAGTRRLEGRLFGIGGRTGTVDRVTLALNALNAPNALNLCAQGVHPVVDSDGIDAAVPAVPPAADQGVLR
jgi:isopropylmalate/homocitrate/citramalate synthase